MAVSPRPAVIGCGAVAACGYLPSPARLGWRPSVLLDPDPDHHLDLDRARAPARRRKTPRGAPEASVTGPARESASGGSVAAAGPRESARD